jgi:hypothetical protein
VSLHGPPPGPFDISATPPGHRRPAPGATGFADIRVTRNRFATSRRVPQERRPGARRQEVRTYDTVTPALLELRDWLICQGVTQVVMEATSAYWKPPFYLLEDDIEC